MQFGLPGEGNAAAMAAFRVETICAPKCPSIRSVWSRLASASITVVAPGAASPASSTADLIWADATGVR